jgi:uncharacterized protein (DUF1697 family)
MSWLVLLHGVNVGGHKTFRPAALAQELADWAVDKIGAAGTFVVRKKVAKAALRAALARRLPFQAQAMLFRASDLLKLVPGDPFA